ncbi:MAG: NAD-dependent epimerase/dehydratase family protein [Acidobacteria bacterium]|nr:MAG: NAD-dependent epimerase/dehydratase family protein [Acidobacteriota bacterium]
MKILVTGGAGFIGSHIVDAFQAAGHRVVVVDDLSTGFQENIPSNAKFYRLDIRDPQLSDVFQMESPDIVCHQAARANVRESMQEPLLYASVNILGSLNLLECCRRHGTQKIIYASTGGAVYGEPQTVPVTEEHPVNPLDPYGASKHVVEHYLYLYRANFGLGYTVLRYPNVYGPRQNPYGEAGVVAIFANQMLKGDQVTINGTGDQERDFVYIADVVRANILALERGDGEICNIGSGIGHSVNQVFAVLAGLSEYQTPPQHGEAKPGEVSRIYLDATKAARQLGWKTEVSFEEGLRMTLDYFRNSTRDWSRPVGNLVGSQS